MLKFTYDNESDIPAESRSLYAQGHDGKWTAQIEGVVAKSVHDEFRNNNIKISQELDKMKSEFAGVDAAEYKKLRKNKDLLDENKLITTDGMEAAVEKRVGAMRAEYDGKIADLEKRNGTLLGDVGKLKIDGMVSQLGIKAGLRPEAQDDFVARAHRVFQLDPATGQVVAPNQEGGVRFGTAGTPLTIEEWVKTTAADKSVAHLFNPSQGGGAAGGGRASGAPNPFKTGNLTEQARLFSSNPAEFTRMQQEHAAMAAAGAGGS